MCFFARNYNPFLVPFKYATFCLSIFTYNICFALYEVRNVQSGTFKDSIRSFCCSQITFDLLEGHAEPSMNIHLQLPQTQSTLLTGKFYRIYGFFLFSQTLLKMLYWKNKQKLSECENNSK